MIIRGDSRRIPLRSGSVQCVVTSPPYWGLRDYGTGTWDGGDVSHAHGAPHEAGVSGNKGNSTTHAGRFVDCLCGARRIDRQIGLEPTPDEYVATMVGVFREVWRVLRDDGTVWLNLGDCYASQQPREHFGDQSDRSTGSHGELVPSRDWSNWKLKPKDLVGMAWRVAFALQADGWYLRSDIIWAKPNPMPESVTDRPTRSHEYLFLLSKRERYFYDADAIREASSDNSHGSPSVNPGLKADANGFTTNGHGASSLGKWTAADRASGRNKRDVWTVNSEPTPEAHFATFPQKLIEPCILAGTSEKGCCWACGAPRVRVTESSIEYSQRIHNGTKYGGNGAFGNQAANRHRDGHVPGTKQVSTLGWQSSCTHDAPSVPCLVFDPFLGSGTVGKVCERLGRRWAGLELSEAYIDIAKKRTAQRGLFAGVDTSHRVG